MSKKVILDAEGRPLFPGVSVRIIDFPDSMIPDHWARKMEDYRGCAATIDVVKDNGYIVLGYPASFQWKGSDFFSLGKGKKANDPNYLFKMENE